MTRGRRGGFAVVAASSAVAGVIGYAITIVAARLLGVEYGAFGVFWSALYFGVGALAGAQQEFARMTRRGEAHPAAPDAAAHRQMVRRAVGAAAIGSVLVSTVATTSLALSALSADPLERILAIGVGFAFFGVYAVLLGMQYGARRWATVATATVADPLLRVVLIVVAIEAGGGLTGATWAAVLPFPILAGALLVVCLRDGSLTLEKAALPALRAAAMVVAGGLASSFLINGVPMLFALVAPSEDPAVVARYVFAFILVRAPLVVGALALQSFLVVQLRDHARPGRLVAMVLLAIAVVTGVGAVVLAAVGDPIIRALGGSVGAPDSAVVIGIAIASGTTSGLIVVGCWALARERRQTFAVGWWLAAAAIVTVAAVVPGDAETRVTLASAVAPALGAIAMAIALRARGGGSVLRG